MSMNKTVIEKMNLVADYVEAKKDFLNMIDNILRLTETPYRVDGDFIGEVHLAGFDYKDGNYLAIDCGIINTLTNETNADTLFIPSSYLGLTDKQLSKIKECEITLLSLESEKLKSEDGSLVKQNRLLN